MFRRADLLPTVLLLASGVCISAQPATTWRDLSPHTARLVNVDQNVQLAIASFLESDVASTERQANAFQTGVPGSTVVRIRNANHYVFLSHEDVVVREIRNFIGTLR